MRCLRVAVSVMVAVFGGAVMALGPAEACPGSPAEHYSMIPSDLCPTEGYTAASEADPAQSEEAEEADYYDRGEVAASTDEGGQDASAEAKSDYRYEYPEESYARYGEADYTEPYSKDDSQEAAPEARSESGDQYSEESYARQGEAGSEADYAEQYYSKGGSQETSPQASSDYRDQYSEEAYGKSEEASPDADYAKQYYPKYGYEYASPEEKYGYDYAGPHAESNADNSDNADNGNNEPMSQESADAEASESYRDGESQDMDKSPAPQAEAKDAAEEATDGMPSEGSENAADAQRSTEPEAAPANTSSDSAYQEHGMENLTAGEQADTVEPNYPTEEETLAQTEQPEAAPATTEQNDEIGPYQMEEYHPRYGYRFGYRRSYYADTTPAEANTTAQSPTADAAPTPAAETESAQSQPEPGSVADRYGYAEYMGEDYLSEIEDSSRAAVDPEQQRQFDPESDEPMDPESSEPVTPEKNASIDAENAEMASAESNGSMGSEFRQEASTEGGDTMAPEYSRSMYPESRDMTATDNSDAANSEGARPADSENTETTPENQESMDPEYGDSKMPENSESSAPAETPAAKADESTSSNYDYAEPYRYYGHDYWRETTEQQNSDSESDQSLRIEESSSMEEPQARTDTESGIELFAYRPAELLTSSDQDLLRTLSGLFEEPSGVRRAALNDYLETQGTSALDFASRFEDLTGIEFLGLADDLPGVAAFLASYRLLEQSELGVDEASDLLRRSLQRLAPDWINGVNEITGNAQESTSEPVNADGVQDDSSMGSASNQVLKALGVLAAQSWRGIGDLANGIPSRFSQVAWSVLLPQFGQDWSVGSMSSIFGDLQR